MCITVKKETAASRSYGRGMDNTYHPAKYDVIRDGVKVGRIFARPITYMEKADWEIYEVTDGKLGKLVRREYNGFKAAKAWAITHFQRDKSD